MRCWEDFGGGACLGQDDARCWDAAARRLLAWGDVEAAALWKDTGTVTPDDVKGQQNMDQDLWNPNDVMQRLWRQVEHGLDAERLLPDREKRARELRKKLDRELEHNGWRIFVAGLAWAMETGKDAQRRNAEVTLVREVTRWQSEVAELLPERIDDFRRLIEAGIANPAPVPKKDGGT